MNVLFGSGGYHTEVAVLLCLERNVWRRLPGRLGGGRGAYSYFFYGVFDKLCPGTAWDGLITKDENKRVWVYLRGVVLSSAGPEQVGKSLVRFFVPLCHAVCFWSSFCAGCYIQQILFWLVILLLNSRDR